MQYETPSSNLPILKYGREMEERVRENCYAPVVPYHSDFGITKTGLHIVSDYPHLDVSPDGTVDCDFCVKGLFEIKYHRNYSTDFRGWENGHKFATDSSKYIRKDHPYFAQMQGQMLLFSLRFCDFFVWTPPENDYQLGKIDIDEHFVLEWSFHWK